MDTRARGLALLLSSVTTAGVSCPAAAQTAPARSTTSGDPVTVSDAGTKPAAQDEEIVVTGSRVVTNGNNSPTPVTVVTIAELAATRPTTVFEALLDLPVFANSGGSLAAPNGAGGSSGAASVLNLRSIGQARTLILYDGHRVAPTSQSGLGLRPIKWIPLRLLM